MPLKLTATTVFDLVIVEPKGRGPQGFRFQIVLDSATRGAESSLDLAADAGGTARHGSRRRRDWE